MSKETIREDREMFVVKANAAVQKMRYSLSVQEQKIVLYLISKIKYTDTDFKECLFDIRDFCRICGIDCGSGNNYAKLKAAVKHIRDTSVYVVLPNGDEAPLAWIDTPFLNRGSGTIRITLNALMAPYLLQLRERYVQYQLYYCLPMQSKYSIRAYELFKSYEKIGSITYSIDEFKKAMDAAKYELYGNLKENVIDIALREIRTYTDLDVSFTPIKSGRAVTSLRFDIRGKKEIGERLLAWQEIDKKLNSGRGNAICQKNT